MADDGYYDITCGVDGCGYTSRATTRGEAEFRAARHVFIRHPEIYFYNVCGVLAPNHGHICQQVNAHEDPRHVQRN